MIERGIEREIEREIERVREPNVHGSDNYLYWIELFTAKPELVGPDQVVDSSHKGRPFTTS